ncbi:cobalt/nickel transport protein [Thermanaeromonas toyohensis ToBE]|uniref:Cobalt/nickel transport protein n=1 Tax=Thermanaeromonas toyohensis ToBE TaxID=698762 RepID=A0A1W1VIU7_9FIRM|nr:PDGLE domain-containing protein [Thermanaeromonas toyohensis]SMB93150.1 cobalt/nickel transport protein [Thermanaeromonas toyohensis ToBE]
MRMGILLGLLIALVVAALLSPFACPYPDGLERVAEDKGFLDLAEGKELIHVPIPDYKFPGISNEGLATSIAGIIGTVLVFGVVYFLGWALAGTRRVASSFSMDGKEEKRE